MRIFDSPSAGPLTIVVSQSQSGHGTTLKALDPKTLLRAFLNLTSQFDPIPTRREALRELRQAWVRRADGAEVVAEIDRLLAQVYTIRY